MLESKSGQVKKPRSQRRVIGFSVFLGFILLFIPCYLFFSIPEVPYQKKTYRFGNLSASLLQAGEDGIVTYPSFVLLILKITSMDRKINAGIYEFDTRMSSFMVLKKLLRGEVKQINLTIVEGFDLYDIAKLLLKNKLIGNEQEWIKTSTSSQAKRLIFQPLLNRFPTLRGQLTLLNSIEGFIYPDTYRVSLTYPIEELLRLSGMNFTSKIGPSIRKVQEESDQRVDWVKLFAIASLIEKETRVMDEKPLVASVIYNRLDRRMKLRFDPTVIYTLKKLERYHLNLKDGFINIKRRHFSLPSPYNTYYRKGLPPGPISSFDRSSLQAALRPASTDYLFFVAKKKGELDTGHYFSKTYREHLEKIQLRTR